MISEWMESLAPIIAEMAAVSALMFVVGVVATPLMLASLREDHFLDDGGPESRRARHPVLHWMWVIAKNVLGALLLLAGIAMLVLPGQGLLCIVVSLTMLDFPGRRRLELSIVRRPAVIGSINWVRTKMGKRPLRLPPEDLAPEE